MLFVDSVQMQTMYFDASCAAVTLRTMDTVLF